MCCSKYFLSFHLSVDFALTLDITRTITARAFTPIPQLSREDALVSLIFLEPNKLAYTGPVDDLFFAAHADPWALWTTPNITLYYSDKQVSVMGCIDQHRICNPTWPDGILCTTWGTVEFTAAVLDKLGLNQMQNDTAWVLLLANLDGHIANSIAGLGSTALRAQSTVYDDINIPLPENQWNIEASDWFSISLARLQHAILEFSTGPEDIDYSLYSRFNLSQLYKTNCGIQKVQQLNFNHGYISFSVLGLVIIFVIGVVIIIVSLVLPRIVGRMQRARKANGCHDTWESDDKFECWRASRRTARLLGEPQPNGSLERQNSQDVLSILSHSPASSILRVLPVPPRQDPSSPEADSTAPIPLESLHSGSHSSTVPSVSMVQEPSSP